MYLLTGDSSKTLLLLSDSIKGLGFIGSWAGLSFGSLEWVHVSSKPLPEQCYRGPCLNLFDLTITGT